MTDRELLELAAKAAGIEIRWKTESDGPYILKEVKGHWFAPTSWNPLTDDGDALRLAVKLELSLDLFHEKIIVGYTTINECEQVEEESDDPYSATRRAIVRAAAEIGRNMK